MSDLLGIGASGISAYSAALGVVGENVANAQTDGYSRRGVSIQSTGSTGASGLYTPTIGLGGAQAGAVTRAWDRYKTNDALSATADDGRAAAAGTWLDSASDALPSGDTGLGAQVTAVFTAASTLAADPSSTTARSQMLNALGTAAGGISTAATELAKVSAGIGSTATGTMAGVNDDLAALAKLNASLAATADGTDAKASLADQRDKLVGDLSGKIGVNATVAANGTVSLTLSGSGVSLLSGNKAALLAVAQGGDGQLSFTASLNGNAGAIVPTGGTMAGLAQAATTVAGLRGGLDAVATGFAAQVNSWNAAGLTAAGTVGGALVSAAGGAASLTLVATSGDAIAAADGDGAANGNLLAFSSLRGTDGAESRLSALIGTTAQALSSAQAQASAASTRKSAALTAQADVGGVSLDQEAADLVRFQQAYQGSAKVIQAAQTTMNAILSLFGG
jgi:flagellar hook-associated protein 1 FlgK